MACTIDDPIIRVACIIDDPIIIVACTIDDPIIIVHGMYNWWPNYYSAWHVQLMTQLL